MTNGKQLPAFPLEADPGTEPWPQRWGGESVTTLPPWRLLYCKRVIKIMYTLRWWLHFFANILGLLLQSDPCHGIMGSSF